MNAVGGTFSERLTLYRSMPLHQMRNQQVPANSSPFSFLLTIHSELLTARHLESRYGFLHVVGMGLCAWISICALFLEHDCKSESF